jgi:ABC-type glycerol-3-phosphate transport system substrate-binding protein
MKKLISVLCVCCLIVPFVFAAGAKESAMADKPVIRVYSAWVETQLPNWQDKIKEYNANKDNPVTIQLEFFGDGGYDDKIKADFIANDPPEIFQLFKTEFNEYSAAGKLLDLTDYLKKTGLSETLNKGAQAWAGPLVNPTNGVFGFPDFANTSCIFYNTKLFKQLGIAEPTDLASLTKATKVLNANGYKAIVTGASNWCAADLFAKVQAQSCGTQVLIDVHNGKAKYTDPALLKALTIVNQMVADKVIDPSSADYGDDEAIAVFVSGQAGMYTAHTAMTSMIDSMAESMEGFDYDIIRNVAFVPDPKVSVPVTWGSLWCIPSSCKNIEGTYAAMEFLFGEELAVDTVKKVGKIYNVESWNKDLSHKALQTAVKYQMPTSATADSFYLLDMVSSKVLDNMIKGIQEMIQGSVTPKQVLENLQATWDNEQAQRQ